MRCVTYKFQLLYEPRHVTRGVANLTELKSSLSIVPWRLKIGIVVLERGSVAEQWLGKHVAVTTYSSEQVDSVTTDFVTTELTMHSHYNRYTYCWVECSVFGPREVIKGSNLPEERIRWFDSLSRDRQRDVVQGRERITFALEKNLLARKLTGQSLWKGRLSQSRKEGEAAWGSHRLWAVIRECNCKETPINPIIRSRTRY
jgi:hypothetical protein